MATLKQKIRAERAGRAMLENGQIPQPDAVEYGHSCIRFFWNGPKVVLVIDLDEPAEGGELASGDFDELEDEAA